MHRPAALARPITGPVIRYVISGAVVTLVYLGLPIALNAAFGISIELCIPFAYVLAVTLQFTLQRVFVFRHVTTFALSVRQQIGWYLAVGAIQYPVSALSVAVLPTLLNVPERVVYVIATATISLVSFLVLRRRVFHADTGEAASSAPVLSAAEL